MLFQKFHHATATGVLGSLGLGKASIWFIEYIVGVLFGSHTQSTVTIYLVPMYCVVSLEGFEIAIIISSAMHTIPFLYIQHYSQCRLPIKQFGIAFQLARVVFPRVIFQRSMYGLNFSHFLLAVRIIYLAFY